jgi:outer membrane immunogenic protein
MLRSAKYIVAVGTLSIALGHAALSADLPGRPQYSAPVAATPISQWTGCYVGGNIGAGWSRNELSSLPSANAISDTGTSIMAGGQFGCDYQVGAVVFGVRNMVNWADLKSSVWIEGGNFNGYTANVTNNWLDLLTARIGYTVGPNWLLYVEGGAAWSNSDLKLISPNGAQVSRFSNTRTGWTFGVGSEYMFARRWSVFLDYKYANFVPDSTSIVAPGVIAPFTANAKSNSHTIIGGVNFRF